MRIAIVHDYLNEFGAWDDLEEWTNKELNGLIVQVIVSNIQDKEGITWEEYEKRAQDGSISGEIFSGVDDNVYFCMSH